MANLTDSELRKLLESYGEDVGPINASTRNLWEKRLLKLQASRIPRRVEKPQISIGDIDIPTTFDSPKKRNGAFNRNDPVSRLKMSSPNSTEASCSSLEFDYSPVTGEPGNSPYPFRAKPKVTFSDLRTDRRMHEIKYPNFEMYRDLEYYQNFDKYGELKDKGKTTHRIPTLDGKKQLWDRETIFRESAADSEEEWSDCDEGYFLAENLVKTKRGILGIIGRLLGYLIKGILIVIIVSLCLDTEYFQSVARGRF